MEDNSPSRGPQDRSVVDVGLLPHAITEAGLRVLVCGGRTFGTVTQFDDHGEPKTEDEDRAWDDRMTLILTLNELHQGRGIACVIHGCAPGADSLAEDWAADALIGDHPRCLVAPFKADWRTHGKAAGPIRNQRMIDEGKPDLVVAFKGGRGTMDMIRRARDAGLKVVTPGWEGVGRAPRPPQTASTGPGMPPNPSEVKP